MRAVLLVLSMAGVVSGQEQRLFDNNGRAESDPCVNLKQCKAISDWVRITEKSRARTTQFEGLAAITGIPEHTKDLSAKDIEEIGTAITMLAKHPDPQMREAGITLIGTVQWEGGVDLCIKAVKARQHIDAATRSLGRLRSAKAIPALIAAYPARNAQGDILQPAYGNAQVIAAIAAIGGKEGRAALELLSKRAVHVESREQIAIALDKLDEEEK